jgi:hypothetical protein
MLFREVGTFFMMFVIYCVSETLHIDFLETSLLLKKTQKKLFFNWKPEQVSGVMEEAWKLEKWTYDIAGEKEKTHFTSLNYFQSLVFPINSKTG